MTGESKFAANCRAARLTWPDSAQLTVTVASRVAPPGWSVRLEIDPKLTAPPSNARCAAGSEAAAGEFGRDAAVGAGEPGRLA
jgi:hypothetical protein